MWEEGLRIYGTPEIPNNFPPNRQAISSYFFVQEYFFPFYIKEITCHTMEKTFFPNHNKGCYLRGNFFYGQEKLSRKEKKLHQFQTSNIGNCMSNIETIFFCWKYLYFLLKTWFVLDGSVPAIQFFW